MKMKIAITGGIGSGKSTVAGLLKNKGYDVFSCDEIYRELLCDERYIAEVARLFPEAVENHVINKERLSKIVFADESARKELNALAHPWIMRTLFIKMENAKGKYAFAEVPLLFEEGYEDKFDKIIVVLRDEEDRITSVMQRSGLSRQEVQNRIKVQFDYSTLNKKNLPLIILRNDVSQDELETKLSEIVKHFS